MRYMMTFFGSCGHTTQEEISERLFADFEEKENYSVTASDDSVSMVYVSPWRYQICRACMDKVLEEDAA